MSRGIVAVTGTCVAIVLAVGLLLQAPAASSLDAQRAKGDSLRRELALVTQRTSATTGTNAFVQQQLTAVTAKDKRVGRQVKRDGHTRAGLRKQVASLQKDVKALGG